MIVTHRANESVPPAASAPHVSSLFETPRLAFQTWRQHFIAACSAWRLRRRQRAELYRLSDSTLKDIGIFRTEIEGIVRSSERDATGRVR
jgi:uncharacterized protein YjiS (DUF1127 family)